MCDIIILITILGVQMGYFKRFSDFCSGFASFTVLIYLFRQFMVFKPVGDEVGTVEKIKMFLSRTQSLERHLLFVLALMLAVSVLAGWIFKRIPFVSCVFTLPPLAFTVDLIKAEYIDEYPLLILLLCIIAFLGGAIECIRRDREDGRHRAAWLADIVSAGTAALLWYICKNADKLAEFSEEEAMELNYFDYAIYQYSADMNLKILENFAIALVVFVVVSLVLSDVYFIDAILALVPAVAFLYLWGAEKLTVHPEIIVTFALANFAARVIPAFSGKATHKKRHFRLVEKQI